MNKIEVIVLNEAHSNPAGMQLFLAKLTQRGHNVQTGADLINLYNSCIEPDRPTDAIKSLAAMPHGTIKRFAPITIAIVGASRRFLAQARTHQVGLDYVSGSLQYSDYSNKAQFVVPYELLGDDKLFQRERYLETCRASMDMYKILVEGPTVFGRQLPSVSNDTAGYAAPQGLRNVLIMQGNHQSWDYFIRLRSCNRNTAETQYVALKIWEALLGTINGNELFAYAGPDCLYGKCREGRMSCGKPITISEWSKEYDPTTPQQFIYQLFPLLKE